MSSERGSMSLDQARETSLNALPFTAPPTTIVTLPHEIVTHITTFLPLPDLVILCRTCKFLHPFLTEDRLWERLNIALPKHHGDYPREWHWMYRNEPSAGTVDMWMARQARSGQAARVMEARERINNTMARAGWEQWGRVREIHLEVRPGSTVGMSHLLEFVQPNLRSLSIEIADDFDPSDLWDGAGHSTLDALILDGPLAFMALTYLRFGPGSILYPFVVPHLCEISPNLSAIDIDVTRDAWHELGPWEPPDTHLEDYPTRIQRMRIKFDEMDDEDYHPMLFGVMEQCPDLRQFSLVPRLRGLDSPSLLTRGIDQTLIISSDSWSNIFTFKHQLPYMRELYFDASLRETPHTPPLPPSASTTYPWSTQDMIPDFVAQLHANPHVQYIHTFAHPHGPIDTNYIDDVQGMDRSDTITGKIYSWKHGTEELVYALLYLPSVEVAYSRLPGPVIVNYATTLVFTDSGDPNGGPFRKEYLLAEQPSWQHFSDHQGIAVPLYVIEGMREAEGKSLEEWEQRGVEVGDKGWAILLEWREDMTKTDTEA